MQWITVGEINAELCDVSLKKYLFHLLGIDEDKAFTLNEKEKVDIINSLHNKIINSPKYLQLRSSLILNQNDYLEYNHNAIFQRELQENLIELYCDYQMLLSHEGMCNIMYYIFYDVYCSKKQLKNIEGYAECKSFSGKQWSWHKNAIFKGLLEEGYFEVKADRFWSNFAKEVISKIGSVFFQIIQHDFDCTGETMLKIEDNGMFIVVKRFGNPEEPWHLDFGPQDEPWHADDYDRILHYSSDKAKDLYGNYYCKTLYSDNELPKFFNWEKEKVELDCGENIYHPIQRKAYGVFQKLKDLGICTKSILKGTVSKTNEPFYSEEFEMDYFQPLNSWSCVICGGDEDSGCLYFDQSECPKFT
jgi:hypothetical protein